MNRVYDEPSYTPLKTRPFLVTIHNVISSEQVHFSTFPTEPVNLYYHCLSSPSRSVLIIDKHLDIHINIIPMDVLKGDQFKPQYHDVSHHSQFLIFFKIS